MRGKAREMTQDKWNELQGGFETAYNKLYEFQ